MAEAETTANEERYDMPTKDQIEKVKVNLQHLQAFNDYLYNNGNAYIPNAYLLLNEPQKDEGLAVCVNMMDAAFWAMAAVEGGPAGSAGAIVLCGIVSSWANGGAPPTDMGQTYASLVSRFQAASRDVDGQLAVYYSDPASYWDTQFSYDGQICTLGDLANIDFPDESDPEFFTLMTPCEWALDQYIWKFILTNGDFIIAEWLPSTDMPTTFDFMSWQNSFYGAHPSYWATCVWHQDTGGCGDESCYYLTQYNLSTGTSAFSDGHISDDACNYLFADRGPGQTYSECTKGLFPREDVFTTWGLRVKQIWLSHAPAPSDKKLRDFCIEGYVLAKKEGKSVLSDLQAEIGVEGIKGRLLDAVKKDPSLRASLCTHPRETMEEILEVIVPEFMQFNFVMEGPRRYGLVLPWGDGGDDEE